MRTFLRAAGGTLLCLAVILALAGCGGPAKAKITGTLSKAGVPLQVNDKTQVTLTFAAEEGNAKRTYPATFKPADGTFDVELPAGKYKANLVIFDHAKKAMVPVPPAFRNNVYDLTENKVVDIDISK